MGSESTIKVVTLSIMIPNGLYVFLSRIKQTVLLSEDFHIHSTLMGNDCDIQPLDSIEFASTYNLIDLPLFKSIAVAATSKSNNRTIAEPLAILLLSVQTLSHIRKCKQKAHHHLHYRNKYTQLSPEANEAIVIANAINNLNRITEATENKVFKKQLQNQFSRLSQSHYSNPRQTPG
ncbi:unnamed protein product [Ambrosiozyma monospora]|uniref:Unnamed protein product n=1 Tax=Ambrosiozyma monospora TaxID=43982 RepID=A0A9W7DD67_AMBMO|nr:unnamed protein product [Ambrosiozyma monospora]